MPSISVSIWSSLPTFSLKAFWVSNLKRVSLPRTELFFWASLSRKIGLLGPWGESHIWCLTYNAPTVQYWNSFRQRRSQLTSYLFGLNTSDCVANQTIIHRHTHIFISVNGSETKSAAHRVALGVTAEAERPTATSSQHRRPSCVQSRHTSPPRTRCSCWWQDLTHRLQGPLPTVRGPLVLGSEPEWRTALNTQREATSTRDPLHGQTVTTPVLSCLSV